MNSHWWREKLRANAARDADTDERLRGIGWHAIRVWEHEPPDLASERVAEAVLAQRKINPRVRADGLNESVPDGA